jgi:hypothetical protein
MYKFSDLNCAFCYDREKKRCSGKICRHIAGNIADLLTDNDFLRALAHAETCKMKCRNTLLNVKNNLGTILKNHTDSAAENQQSAQDNRTAYNCHFRGLPAETNDFKPECKTCKYAGTGFVCCSSSGGTCLKDWVNSVRKGGVYE